jgi:hypothetical protein
MELLEFLQQTQAQVGAEIDERLAASGAMLFPYKGSVFAEIVMQHMHDIGMTFEPVACHLDKKYSGTMLRLSGYSVSEDSNELDLFVSLYSGSEQLETISDIETMKAAEQCLQLLTECFSGKLAARIDEKEDAYALVLTVQDCYTSLEQIRIYVLTDRVAKSKNFKSREVGGKTVKLEVMDIERLHRHWSEGKPRDELIANFTEICGSALPCVYVPGEMADYDYALTAIPGEALQFLYEKFGARLLEANVRSFLSSTGKVNRGIRDTLRDNPERFMAYNNGIVIVADEASLVTQEGGGISLSWLRGMQIVNGGQTTASIYFSKKKSPEIKLGRVRVAAKIIILHSDNSLKEEMLISDISKFANSQNAVRQSDLSANKPFHVEVEKLALSTYCPDGAGRWFYERAAGSYNVMLSREGSTPARLRQVKLSIPPSRKFGKTDLAKYLNAWDRKPDLVSLGAQKNFDRFMAAQPSSDDEAPILPDLSTYKSMISKGILFKKAHTLVRSKFPAFQANITAYLIALVAEKLGNRMDLEKIWQNQDVSPALRIQLERWAGEVNTVLHASAGGRMVSEWAKKAECWEKVRNSTYSDVAAGIPELRPTSV